MKRTLLFLSAVMLIISVGCAKKPATATAQAAPEKTKTAAPAVQSVKKTVSEGLRGEALMKAIADNYQGKVVLVDFWATWCPPCRAAMKTVKEIKPELEKKGCVFVYITGETSPIEDWETMIAEISGEHYRLTDAQWESVAKLYNIPGIPVYMILGKDGKPCYDNFSEGGYPGSEVLKNNMEVALTK